jgi:hypothetical protein
MAKPVLWRSMWTSASQFVALKVVNAIGAAL